MQRRLCSLVLLAAVALAGCAGPPPAARPAVPAPAAPGADSAPAVPATAPSVPPQPEFGPVSYGEIAQVEVRGEGRTYILPRDAVLRASVGHTERVEFRFYVPLAGDTAPAMVKPAVVFRGVPAGDGHWQFTWGNPPSDPHRLFLLAEVHPDTPADPSLLESDGRRWAVKPLGVVRADHRSAMCTPEPLRAAQVGAPEPWLGLVINRCQTVWERTTQNLRISVWLDDEMSQTGWNLSRISPFARRIREVSIAGPTSSYPALVYLSPPWEKTGGEFWGPKPWQLTLSGQNGTVTFTCSTLSYPQNLEEGHLAQQHVDRHCPEILSAVRIGDLGNPYAPTLTRMDEARVRTLIQQELNLGYGRDTLTAVLVDPADPQVAPVPVWRVHVKQADGREREVLIDAYRGEIISGSQAQAKP